MLNSSNQKEIERVTRFNVTTQNQIIRSMAKLDLDARVDVMKIQISEYHSLKPRYEVKSAILGYCSLILAIDEFYSKKDETDVCLSTLKTKKLVRAQKREYLLGKWSIVRRLKLKHGLGFRRISEYIEDKYGVKISYSLIYQLWLEFEDGEKKNERL